MKLAGPISAAIVLGLGLVACSAGSPVSQVSPPRQIAFLLPSSDPRYVNRDGPIFQAKVLAVCPSCEVVIRNANHDAATQQSQAEAALKGGATVLVLDAVDAEGAASIVARASARHVPVIAYDTLVLDAPGLAYYVSFDGQAIGALQAKGLLDALSGKAKPTIVMIDGNPADAGAALLRQGAHSVLDGKVTVAQEYSVASGSADEAGQDMTRSLQALNGKVDGVYAASDGLASGAIAAMKQAGISLIPPVTGADSELDAIQRLLTGDQYMTVYESTRLEAEAAAQLAYDLAYGVPVPGSLTGGKTVANGSEQVPAVLLAPVAVTRGTMVSTVLADGFWTREQICTATFASACGAAGIS